jgi:hypothetical protein
VVGLFIIGLLIVGVVIGVAFLLSDNLKVTTVAGIASFVIVFGCIAWYLTGTESGKRTVKSFQSDIGHGIERTVYVYDREGDLIKKYEGKFDIETNDNKVLFDINGKRVIIYNATVIAEEK